MHHKINRIISKSTDYKLCQKCNTINWYENKECVYCYHTNFKVLGKRKLLKLEKEFDDLEFQIQI